MTDPMPFAFVALCAVMFAVAIGRRRAYEVFAYSVIGLVAGGLIRIAAGVP
jgi:hypothetical protein